MSKKYLDHCFLCGQGVDMTNSNEKVICDCCQNTNTRTPEPTKAENGLESDAEFIYRSYSIDARSEEFNSLMNKLGYLNITKEQLLAILPEKVNKIPGKGCKCAAHGECECGCGADWTDYETWNKYHDAVKQRIEELFKEQG